MSTQFPEAQLDDQGRIRVRIIEAAGLEVGAGFVAADPEKAKPHFEKLGWCEYDAPHPSFGTNPKITLDDGSVIWGFECWWEPVKEAQA